MHLARISTLIGFLAVYSTATAQYEFRTFDVPGATRTEPYGINNLGHIVGTYYDATGVHGFLYDGTAFQQIRFPGEAVTNPRDINDHGHIVGYTGNLVDMNRGFLFDGSTFSYIDYPGARITRADGINNVGQIVGLYSDSALAGFVFNGSEFSSIVAPQRDSTAATAISDSGLIVGTYIENHTFQGFTIADGRIQQFMFGTCAVGHHHRACHRWNAVFWPGPGRVWFRASRISCFIRHSDVPQCH